MWFQEKLFKNIRLNLTTTLVYKTKTPYQNLAIYQTPDFGKMLVLDDTIQTTQYDEFIYHEMLTHPLLLTHPSPKNILIIGAGDGGILREVLKHSVKKVYLVEIDEKVIDISKKYLPSINKGAFNDRRVNICIDNGATFIEKFKEKCEIIIIDSSDPTGPAKVLFSNSFYKNVKSTLTSDGIMIRQTGSTLLQPNEVVNTYHQLKKFFPFSFVQLMAIPTYIGGFFSAVIASKKINLEKVDERKITQRYKQSGINTRYYNPDIHYASMKLPNYIKRRLR